MMARIFVKGSYTRRPLFRIVWVIWLIACRAILKWPESSLADLSDGVDEDSGVSSAVSAALSREGSSA